MMTTRRQIIRDARAQRNMTAREVAALIHTPEPRVYRLEAEPTAARKTPITDETIGRYHRADLLSDEQTAIALRLPELETSEDVA